MRETNSRMHQNTCLENALSQSSKKKKKKLSEKALRSIFKFTRYIHIYESNKKNMYY